MVDKKETGKHPSKGVLSVRRDCWHSIRNDRALLSDVAFCFQSIFITLCRNSGGGNTASIGIARTGLGSVQASDQFQDRSSLKCGCPGGLNAQHFYITQRTVRAAALLDMQEPQNFGLAYHDSLPVSKSVSRKE